MGKPLLFLRLEAPLQSWGLRARWDVRDTGSEPSKSGVVGLLGCAFGYPRDDPRLNELDTLTMGLRIEQAGSRLTDFHTVSGSFPTAEGGQKGTQANPTTTIVSYRTYLQDAAFLVVLDGPDALLERCASALQHPRWPVFLGRKACPPTRPVFDGLCACYSNLEEALRRHPWDISCSPPAKGADSRPRQLWCLVDDPGGELIRPDRLNLNPARMYNNRRVRRFPVDFPGSTTSSR